MGAVSDFDIKTGQIIPPTEKSASGSYGPAASALLAGATGGLSLPLQMAAQGGGEAALQATGVNPPSATQIGLAAGAPYGANKIAKGVAGLGRFAANLLGKGQRAGEQAIAKTLDVPGDVIERSTHAPSKALYKEAEAPGGVNVQAAKTAVDNAIDAEKQLGSQANKAIIKKLQGISDDLASGTEDAGVMVAKAQRLVKDAEGYQRRAPSVAKSLKDTSGHLKESVPGLKQADVAYTRENVVDDIFNAVSKNKKVESLDALLRDKGDKVRSVIADKDLKDIYKIASQIENIGGSEPGILKTGYNAVIKSFISDPNGLTSFRHAFGPNLEKMTSQGIVGLLTLMRGQKGQDGNN
jgi:hypothetical protein